MNKSHIEEVLTERASVDRKIRKFLKAGTGIPIDSLSMDTFHNRLVINCTTEDELMSAAEKLRKHFHPEMTYEPVLNHPPVKLDPDRYLVEIRDYRIPWITLYLKGSQGLIREVFPKMTQAEFDAVR